MSPYSRLVLRTQDLLRRLRSSMSRVSSSMANSVRASAPKSSRMRRSQLCRRSKVRMVSSLADADEVEEIVGATIDDGESALDASVGDGGREVSFAAADEAA